MPKNLEAKKKREEYERRVRDAARERNSKILIAGENYKAEVKAIRREIYG